MMFIIDVGRIQSMQAHANMSTICSPFILMQSTQMYGEGGGAAAEYDEEAERGSRKRRRRIILLAYYYMIVL